MRSRTKAIVLLVKSISASPRPFCMHDLDASHKEVASYIAMFVLQTLLSASMDFQMRLMTKVVALLVQSLQPSAQTYILFTCMT